MRIAWGGAESQAKMFLMVGEKVVAAIDAANTLMASGTQSDVIALGRGSSRTTPIA